VHIPKLTDFWAWQLLGEPAYERNPLRAHQPVHARTPFGEVHYQRWLELFETTVNELFAGPVAELAKGRARRMATAMRRLLDGESAIGDAAVEVLWAKENPRSTRP
jgi:hemoglobin